MERKNISWNGKKKFHWIVVTFGMFYCPFVARFVLLFWQFDNLYDFLYEKHDISWYNLWRLCDCAIRWVSIVNKVNKIFDEQHENNPHYDIWRFNNHTTYIFSSLWNVTRNHSSFIGLRCSIHWIEKRYYCWMYYISNCDVPDLLFSPAFVGNGFYYIWISLLSWCQHCTYTTNDYR